MSTFYAPPVHWKSVCRICRAQIDECQCAAPGKTLRWGICRRCTLKIADDVKRLAKFNPPKVMN